MLNAVNHGDTSRMQRSLYVGQFQLLACVYHVFPGDQPCIPEIIIIDFFVFSHCARHAEHMDAVVDNSM